MARINITTMGCVLHYSERTREQALHYVLGKFVRLSLQLICQRGESVAQKQMLAETIFSRGGWIEFFVSSRPRKQRRKARKWLFRQSDGDSIRHVTPVLRLVDAVNAELRKIELYSCSLGSSQDALWSSLWNIAVRAPCRACDFGPHASA